MRRFEMSSFGTTRTGRIGRLARILLLAAPAFSLLSIADEGGLVAFREMSIHDEFGVLLITAVSVVLFVHLVGELARALGGDRVAVRARILASLGLAMAIAVTAAAGQRVSGRVWGYPLADVVWWFDVAILGETIVALALAIVLGTPGCEIGVWTELIYRARGERTRAARWVLCLVGLNFVEEWEARRREQPDEEAPGKTGEAADSFAVRGDVANSSTFSSDRRGGTRR
jgi:hypothetical protein